MKELIFATNNAHKLVEVKKILNGVFDIKGLQEAGINEDIPENENTLEGNARAKAEYVHNRLKCSVFADDTGLEIEALNGEPGVYSARYAGEGRDAVDNMNKVLEKMRNKTNRRARFRTVIHLILSDKHYSFEGIVEGVILTKPTGSDGFGYDPVFKPNGYDISFAEMSMDEKNRISHRGRAMQKLIKFLTSEVK